MSPWLTLPADDIAAVITFIVIALFLALALSVIEACCPDKPKRQKRKKPK